MLREHLERVINRILRFNEERKYNFILKNNSNNEDKIEIRISYMEFLMESKDYGRAFQQAEIIQTNNYEGSMKKKFLENLSLLREKSALKH